MSFSDQMNLLGLIELSLLILVSKGQNWNVSVNRSITATVGSNVTVWCKFTVPKEHYTQNVQVYWKNSENSEVQTFDKEPNAFVFHPNDTFVLEKYRAKTKLIGNKAEGDCSLKIFNITDDEPYMYMRVIAKADNYSFKKDSVSISVSGQGVTPVTIIPDSPTVDPTHAPTTTKYLAIFVPVAVLLIVIFVTGIIFCKKQKRSQSFTREESGYYANFSRAPSNEAKREASSKIQENKKLPELQTIDEPVYINAEALSDQMDRSMDHRDNVYGNVDYCK